MFFVRKINCVDNIGHNIRSPDNLIGNIFTLTLGGAVDKLRFFIASLTTILVDKLLFILYQR